MSISWSDVTDIAPELSTVPVGRQNKLIAYAEADLDEDVWGDLYEQGLVYYIAHRATLTARAGAGGSVQSESVGSVSRSYGTSVASDAALFGSTSYGQIFQQLLMSCAAARFEIST